MKYVENSSELSVNASFVSDFDGYTAAQIAKRLGEKEQFSEITKTNRAMWPDKETKGVKYESSDERIEIKITGMELKIIIDELSAFEEAYETLVEVLQEENMNAPSFESFGLKSMTFYCDQNNLGIGYDITKSKTNENFGNIYEYNSINFNYSRMQGMVSFIASETVLTYSEFKSLVDHIIKDNLLLIGDSEEIESEVER